MTKTSLPLDLEFQEALRGAEALLDQGVPLGKERARALIERSLVRLMGSVRPAIADRATARMMHLYKLLPKKPRTRKKKVVASNEDPQVPRKVKPRPSITTLRSDLGL